MTTNPNGHSVWNLTNRVMAVIDDEAQAQAAVDTLEQAGVHDHDVAAFCGTEGVRELDADGVHGGGVKQALRALQQLTVEGLHLRHYQAELTQGHLVVEVALHGREQRDAIVQILRSHGGHFVNAYSLWTIENMAA